MFYNKQSTTFQEKSRGFSAAARLEIVIYSATKFEVLTSNMFEKNLKR